MIEIDPLVKRITAQNIKEDIDEYRSLIDRNAPEEVIHQFLANHSYFFNDLIRLFNSSPLYSKIKLGSDFELDFCFMDPSSFGPNWVFIEIEKPEYKLFNKSGDPSNKLSHAIRQVQDWQNWVSENISYARKTMPGINYPRGYVFIGRRKELEGKPELINRLERINYDNRLSVEVRTFDYFITSALSVLNLLNKENLNGFWDLPLKALGNTNLKMGFPIEWRDYFRSHSLKTEDGKFWHNEKMEDLENLKNQSFDDFSG